MVQLLDGLVVNDVPGVPGKGVRHTLRERYNIEVRATLSAGSLPTGSHCNTQHLTSAEKLNRKIELKSAPSSCP